MMFDPDEPYDADAVQADADAVALIARAERLWPGNAYLQIEWLRAVDLVRRTRRGWLIDLRAPRLHTILL